MSDVDHENDHAASQRGIVARGDTIGDTSIPLSRFDAKTAGQDLNAVCCVTFRWVARLDWLQMPHL